MTEWNDSARVVGEERILLQILDDFALAIFMITPDLSVAEMNVAARELIAHCRGIAVVSGQLRLEEKANHDELVKAVGLAVRRPTPERPWAYAMVVSKGSEPPLYLGIRPLAGGPSVARASILAVYVVDPQQQPALDDELLRRVYRFSPAEVRVVSELLAGHNAETIADLLSVSIHTVRTHLKSLFAKTGARRQGELIRLVASLLGGLRSYREIPPFEGCANDETPLNSEASPNKSEIRDASGRDS
jgi:DNA-binding CsgD family transcriptional regulator